MIGLPQCVFWIGLSIAVWCQGAGTASAADLDTGRKLLLAAKVVEGSVAPDPTLSGKPVIVTFFASWCPPCTDEFKALNQVRARYGADRVAIVAVNAFEDWGGKKNPARMARFVARTRPSFPLVEGSAATLKAFGGVERIPTLIIYAADGHEVWRFVHEVDATKRSATAQEIFSVLARLSPG